MGNVGTNIGNAISDIIKWLTAAFKKVTGLLAAGDGQNATLLLADIQIVVTSYLDVINQFFPKESVAPFPKNFFSRLTWVSQNLSWLTVLMTLVTGANPFDYAKSQAASIAMKWGFSV